MRVTNAVTMRIFVLLVPFFALTFAPVNAGALTVTNFAVTPSSYAWNSDMTTAVSSVFGDQYRLADWSDLVQYYNEGNDMTPLLNLLRPTRNWVSLNGSEIYSGDRHYFVNVSDHSTPGGFLVHADIDNHLLDLGSWFNPRPILAFTAVPEPTSLALILGLALPLFAFRLCRVHES